MNKEILLEKIKVVEKLATSSKLVRMLNNPYKYFNAILHREVIYSKTKNEKSVVSGTFFGQKMHLLLPSSTDIYLTGGKSHESEIRLAKFIIHKLDQGDSFMDIGGHYGYFSLLASELVGSDGSVITFEASPKTYKVLDENQKRFSNIATFNIAVSDVSGHLTFYEFPNQYSEYNTLDVSQFRNEEWFKEFPPTEIKIDSLVMDDFISQKDFSPKMIKIDVEGAEYKVIQGMKFFLTERSPAIIMEFLSSDRGDEEHIKADLLLRSLSYRSFKIDHNGMTQEILDVPSYIKSSGLESDNIVYLKSK